jgi:hypothetical protein
MNGGADDGVVGAAASPGAPHTTEKNGRGAIVAAGADDKTNGVVRQISRKFGGAAKPA